MEMLARKRRRRGFKFDDEGHRLLAYYVSRQGAKLRAARRIGYEPDDVRQEVAAWLLRTPPKATTSQQSAAYHAAAWATNRVLARLQTVRDEVRPVDYDDDGDRNQVDATEAIGRALRSLTHQERTVIQLLFGIGDGWPLSAAEAAGVLGVTKTRIHQIASSGMEHLRDPVGFSRFSRMNRSPYRNIYPMSRAETKKSSNWPF